MKRTTLLLVALIATTWLLACGGAEEDAPRSVAQDWITAAQKADGEKACALMTPQARRNEVDQARIASTLLEAASPKAGTCVEYFEDPSSVEAFKNWAADPSIRVDGARAVATFDGARERVEPMNVEMLKRSGGWQVDDPGRASYPPLSSGEKECVASWNDTVERGGLPVLPFDGQTLAEDLWANIGTPSQGTDSCFMTVLTPDRLMLFRDEADGWAFASSAERERGSAIRNVWMNYDSTLVALGEHDSGDTEPRDPGVARSSKPVPEPPGEAAATAARTCEPVRASGEPFGSVVVQVRVEKGKVSCTEARRVATIYFSGGAGLVAGTNSATSYNTVSGGWRGTGRSENWGFDNMRLKSRIGGSFRYVCGTRSQSRPC